MRRIRLSLTSLATVVLLVSAVTLVAMRVREELRGYRVLRVEPTVPGALLEPGSYALVRATAVDQLHRGEVVAYRHPDRPQTAIFLRIVDTRPLDPPTPLARDVRLAGKTPAFGDVWDATLYGAAWRVVFTLGPLRLREAPL